MLLFTFSWHLLFKEWHVTCQKSKEITLMLNVLCESSYCTDHKKKPATTTLSSCIPCCAERSWNSKIHDWKPEGHPWALRNAESEGICTMEPRAPRTSLQPGLPEFSSTLLHGLVLFCRDPEAQISTAVTSWLWVWRDTLQQTLKWIREPVYYSGEVAREPTYLNSFQ